MEFWQTVNAFDYNLSKLFFISSILVIGIIGTIINSVENILPHIVLQAFKFGKAAHKAKLNAFVSYLEVPKRWFLHFYIFASVVATIAIVEMWRMYRHGSPLSLHIDFALDILTTFHRTATVSGTSAVLALVLFTFHLYRRLYESVCVSVFSSAHMNLVHYILGICHYLACVVLLVAEFPGFQGKASDIPFTGVKMHHAVGMLLCLACFVAQHHTLSILAGLRRKQGTKGKERHMLPVGGLFQWVSCPHMLAEIGIYIGVLITLGSHTGWALITVWVITNQVQIALLNHKWYQDTFKDYPKERRAIIPYLL